MKVMATSAPNFKQLSFFKKEKKLSIFQREHTWTESDSEPTAGTAVFGTSVLLFLISCYRSNNYSSRGAQIKTVRAIPTVKLQTIDKETEKNTMK